MAALLKLIRDNSGGAVFEIALIAMMFGIVAIAAMQSVGTNLSAT